MKTILSIMSSAAVLMLAISPANADLLNNGNFNTGTLPSWWGYTPDAGNQSIAVLPADAFSYDNTPYAHIRDFTSPAASAAVLGQEVDLSAGSQYNVSLMYRANQWGGGGVGTWYWDSSWAQIGYEWTSLYTGNGTDTGWLPFTSPTWTTPANTAHVSVRLDAWSWSDTYYDNVSFNVIPEPTSVALLAGAGLAFLIIRRRRS
jgi:hypothetical protein